MPWEAYDKYFFLLYLTTTFFYSDAGSDLIKIVFDFGSKYTEKFFMLLHTTHIIFKFFRLYL